MGKIYCSYPFDVSAGVKSAIADTTWKLIESNGETLHFLTENWY